MLLAWLIIVPVLGALAALLASIWRNNAARWVALATLAAELGLTLAAATGGGSGPWLAQTHWTWIPQLGIAFRLDLDGLSLTLIFLTIGLGMAAIVSSWTEI